MRFSTLPFVAVLAAGAAGCANNSQPRYQGYPGYNPGYPGYNPGPWQPLPPPGGPQASPGFSPWATIFRPVNVQALWAMQGRVPCAPKEVAPGTWVTFDCAPFQAITQAIQYIPFIRFNFLPTGPLPAAVDHRSEGAEGPVKDQGAVGACTAVSLSTAMDNAVRRMGRNDVISALHIWSRYGIGIHGQAGDSNVGKSIALEQTWQYDPVKACKLSKSPMDNCGVAYGVSSGSEAFDPALKAEHANADASGRYKLASIERLSAKPANPTEIAGVIAGGDDVWISFSVNDQAWTSKAMQNAVIPDYDVVEDTGHAVVLAGYRTLPNGTKQFLIHNSWSTRWGENGYGWISEAMVTKYTRAAYRVRVSDGGGGGGPASTGGDCLAGQTREPLFGTCIPGAIPGGATPGGATPGGATPGGFPGIPGIPGLPLPGQAPAAPAQPAKPQQGASCPKGQAQDMMSGQCVNLCPGGSPPVGGMCLPLPR